MEPGDTYLLMLEEKEGVGYCAPAFSFSFFIFRKRKRCIRLRMLRFIKNIPVCRLVNLSA